MEEEYNKKVTDADIVRILGVLDWKEISMRAMMWHVTS
jgi:hypothetical protein